MSLPIDTSKLTVLCGAPPVVVLDQDGKPKANSEGQPLFRTDIITMGLGRPQVFGVRTPGEPKALTVGGPVNVSALSISTFITRDGGTGVFYDAESIVSTKATNTREAS
jgi:hypothetical protein